MKRHCLGSSAVQSICNNHYFVSRKSEYKRSFAKIFYPKNSRHIIHVTANKSAVKTGLDYQEFRFLVSLMQYLDIYPEKIGLEQIDNRHKRDMKNLRNLSRSYLSAIKQMQGAPKKILFWPILGTSTLRILFAYPSKYPNAVSHSLHIRASFAQF